MIDTSTVRMSDLIVFSSRGLPIHFEYRPRVGVMIRGSK